MVTLTNPTSPRTFTVTNPDGSAVDFQQATHEPWYPMEYDAKGFMVKGDGTVVVYSHVLEEHCDCPPGRFLVRFDRPEPTLTFEDSEHLNVIRVCQSKGGWLADIENGVPSFYRAPSPTELREIADEIERQQLNKTTS